MATSIAKKSSAKEGLPEVHQALVVKEVSLEQQINNKLAENNITRKVLNALKEKYLTEDKTALKEDFILKDKTDKETYLIIKKERLGVRKIGVLTESVCKKGREDAIQIQKGWLGKEKETLLEVATVQDKLDEQIKIFEDEEKRLEAEENQRKDNVYNERQIQLIKMGAVFANGCLNINDLSIETNNIREADEEIYNETILPLFQRQYEKNEQAKIAEQQKKDEEARILKEQQDKLAEEQRKFREEQEAFKKQQEELQQQQNAARIAEEQRKHDAAKVIYNARVLRVQELGLTWDFKKGEFAGYGVTINNEFIQGIGDEEFEEKITNCRPLIARVKAEQEKEAEEKRLADIEAAKQKAIKDEQERVAEQQRQEKIKAEQEEARRLEEAAKATDKEKWSTFTAALNQFVVEHMPEFKSKIYIGKRNMAKEKMEEISNL